MSEEFTTADVLANIKKQLDWRGPGGSPQGHIVLSRGYAEFLHKRIIDLINQRDAALMDIELLKTHPDAAKTS